MRLLDRQEVEAIARGSVVLGTGGGDDPFPNQLAAIRTTRNQTDFYPTKVIYSGKIVEVYRRTAECFAEGTPRIHVLDGEAAGELKTLRVDFQNENFIARNDGRILSVVPSLICVLDGETAEPISTEELRYGQRVNVLVVTVPRACAPR